MSIPSDVEIVAFMIRPDLSDTKGNWRFLEEGQHSKMGVTSIETLEDRIIIQLVKHFEQVFTFVVAPDETLTRHGIHAGMSGGISQITIFLKKEGMKGFRNPRTLRYVGSNVGILVVGSNIPA